jgi:hypothetical protein
MVSVGPPLSANAPRSSVALDLLLGSVNPQPVPPSRLPPLSVNGTALLSFGSHFRMIVLTADAIGEPLLLYIFLMTPVL